MNYSPVLALSYASYYGHTFEEFLVTARDQGFAAVQVIPDQAPNLYSDFSSQRRRILRAFAEESGIALHLHNVFYDINIVSMVPAVRRLALDITRDIFALGEDCGALSVTVHPGYMFGGWRRDQVQRDRFWQLAAESLAELGAIASASGLDLLLENGSYYLTTAAGLPAPTPLHLGILPDELLRVAALAGKGARVTLDINKAVRSGLPFHQFLEVLRGRIGQFQISTPERCRAELSEIVRWAAEARTSPVFVLEGSRTEAAAARTLIGELFAGT
jgi:sugar phosphate isomerase/epimerase